MFESTKVDGDDSGEESGDDEERPGGNDNEDGNEGSEHVGAFELFSLVALTPFRILADLHHQITWFCWMPDNILAQQRKNQPTLIKSFLKCSPTPLPTPRKLTARLHCPLGILV